MSSSNVPYSSQAPRRFFGVYLLTTAVHKPCRTYIGFTTDPQRRLRQHNGELKCGGANKTKRWRPWLMVLVVHGFACLRQGLMFEWAWQNPGRCRALAEWRTGMNENCEQDTKGGVGKKRGKRRKRGLGLRGMGRVSVENVVQVLEQLVKSRPFVLMPLALTIVEPGFVNRLSPNLMDDFGGHVEICGCRGFGKLGDYDWRKGGERFWNKADSSDCVMSFDDRCRCVTCGAEIERNGKKKVTVCCTCMGMECVKCIVGRNHGDAEDNAGDSEKIGKGFTLVKDQGKCGKCGTWRRWSEVVRGVRIVDRERWRRKSEYTAEDGDNVDARQKKGISEVYVDTDTSYESDEKESSTKFKGDTHDDGEIMDLIDEEL